MGAGSTRWFRNRQLPTLADWDPAQDDAHRRYQHAKELSERANEEWDREHGTPLMRARHEFATSYAEAVRMSTEIQLKVLNHLFEMQEAQG
jgi:hypothetical protein